jgi:hypothetical protein
MYSIGYAFKSNIFLISRSTLRRWRVPCGPLLACLVPEVSMTVACSGKDGETGKAGEAGYDNGVGG